MTAGGGPKTLNCIINRLQYRRYVILSTPTWLRTKQTRSYALPLTVESIVAGNNAPPPASSISQLNLEAGIQPPYRGWKDKVDFVLRPLQA